MPLPKKPAPEKIKKFRLPGARAYIDSLPPWGGEEDRQRRIYLDRLEQLLAAKDTLGMITTADAYKQFLQAAKAFQGKPATAWQTLLTGKGLLPNVDIIAPSQDELSRGIPIKAEEAWSKYFSALTGDIEAEAQSEVALQRAKQKAITQYQQEQTEIENKRISDEQFNQAKMAQFGQRQQAEKEATAWADRRQFSTMFGANPEQGTGVLGAFNMAGLETGRWQKQQLYGAFEDWRGQSLKTLTGSGNWIRRWEIQHMPNPYQAEEPTPLGEASEIVGRLDTEIERLESIAQYYPSGSAPKGSELDQLIQAVPVALADLKSQHDEWQATRDRLLSEPYSDFRAPSAPWQKTPPAPKFLTGLVPGLGEGQPIYKGATVPTPSMQQWGRMLPSEQEMFGGFLDWSQGSGAWDDIIAKTKRMLPESIGLGGRGGWSPARQGR